MVIYVWVCQRLTSLRNDLDNLASSSSSLEQLRNSGIPILTVHCQFIHMRVYYYFLVILISEFWTAPCGIGFQAVRHTTAARKPALRQLAGPRPDPGYKVLALHSFGFSFDGVLVVYFPGAMPMLQYNSRFSNSSELPSQYVPPLLFFSI